MTYTILSNGSTQYSGVSYSEAQYIVDTEYTDNWGQAHAEIEQEETTEEGKEAQGYERCVEEAGEELDVYFNDSACAISDFLC